jgi:hypothetical protein
LTTTVGGIGVSLVHMCINRMTRHAINLQEAVISDLILQYLEEATHRRDVTNQEFHKVDRM